MWCVYVVFVSNCACDVFACVVSASCLCGVLCVVICCFVIVLLMCVCVVFVTCLCSVVSLVTKVDSVFTKIRFSFSRFL